MIEDESRIVNALFVERNDTLQKIAEVSKEILQDQLFIKKWILMTTRILSQQTLMIDVSIAYQKGKKPDKELPTQIKSCEHDWNENTIINYTISYYCRMLTTDMSRLNCLKCQLTTCTLCARNCLGKTVNVKGKQPHKLEEEKDFSSNEVKLLKELLKEKTKQSEKSLLVKDLTYALKIIDQLKIKQIRLREQKDEKIRKLKAQLQKEKENETKARYSSEEFPPLGNTHIARPFMEEKVHYSGNTTTALKIRKITNQLYNVKVKFEIPSCPMFGTTAIIDTWASTCYINKKVIPEDALKPLT
nr:RNA-directed DNA polymerase [Tanacetum cinerariifolium]